MSSKSPDIYQMPSEAFFACSHSKSSEKPAKEHDFMGSEEDKEANQIIAPESLLDLVNSHDVQVLKTIKTEFDPIGNATMKAVITSPWAENPIMRINPKKRKVIITTIKYLC